MSTTPTPVEIVRDFLRFNQEVDGAHYSKFTSALASVLRDAERFNALELALTDDRIFVSTPDPHDDDLWAPHDGTLAELADRLRKETP